jgi:hypothetical protein
MKSECTFCKFPVSPETDNVVTEYDVDGEAVSVAHGDCAMHVRKRRFIHSGYLSTWLVTEASVRVAAGKDDSVWRRIDAEQKVITNTLRRFEEMVWFGGLQAKARASKTKGLSAVANGLKLMVYTMCGRAMITLERDDGTSVTTITEKTSSDRRMGLHGVSGTEGHICPLIHDAIALWQAGSLQVQEDREVSLGF